MAQGFRSLAGFPLGAGVGAGLSPPLVGFTSLFWWMGGCGTAVVPPVVVDNFDTHDGKRKKPQDEVNRESYVRDRKALSALLNRLFGFDADEPDIAPPTLVASLPVNRPISPVLQTFIKTGALPVQELTARLPEAMNTEAYGDVMAEYAKLRQRMLEEEEIAIVLAMMN